MELTLENFQHNLNRYKLDKQSKILVAVSGGIDSMVLINLLLQSDINFAIAHCNFQLRGNDSDLDEQFVKEFAQKQSIPIHIKRFDVNSYQSSGNFSLQMAARNLRYEWFEELRNNYQYNYLMTAHHLNDSLETFLINISRGTGMEGLKGIPSQNDWKIRPLLSYSKSNILEFANKNLISWREDASNQKTDYVRNKIRHEISPKLDEIHPEFLENFRKSIQLVQQQSEILNQYFTNVRNEIMLEENGNWVISIEKLKELKPLETYLFHLFEEFGWKHPHEIAKLIHSNDNGEIQSKTHRLVKNRNELYITPIQENDFPNEIELDQDQILEKPLYLRFSKTKERAMDSSESIDFDQLKLPLKLRKYRTGDYFFPIGMKGSKKLSKFFKDLKFSKIDKENAWVLVDATDSIVYVVGKRLDERFKITDNTHNFLNIYLC